jgi:hypothetical protein
VALVSLIFPKRKILLWRRFLLCLAMELYETSPGSAPRTVLGVSAFVTFISSSQQLSSWRHLSTVLSFRATEEEEVKLGTFFPEF